METPFYRYYKFSIPAGSVYPLHAFGSYIRVLSNSDSANASPQFTLNGGSAETLPSGIGLKLPVDSQNFYDILFINPDTVNPMALEIAISSDEISDSRLQVAGTITEVNSAGIKTDCDAIKIDCDAMKVDLDAINTATAASKINLDGILTALGNTLASWVTALANLLSIKNNTRSLNGDTGAQLFLSGGANSSTSTIYTVTAGKTFYLAGFNFCGSSSAAFNDSWLRVYNGAVVSLTLCEVDAGIGNFALGNPIQYPIKIPAGYAFKIYADTSIVAKASLWGWEE